MTTQHKYASIKMPASGHGNLIKGGRYWVSENFDIAQPVSWNGIVLDGDGLLVGAANKGISVWESGAKRVQIAAEGIGIFGGYSFWVPDGYDPNDQDTWHGVVIDYSGINVFSVGLPRVTINSGGIFIRGGSSSWVPEDFDPEDVLTWTGVMIDSTGIRCYETSSESAAIINRVDISQSGIVVRGGSSAWLPENFDQAVPVSWRGLILDKEGLRCYEPLFDENGEFEQLIKRVDINYAGAIFAGGLTIWTESIFDPDNPKGVVIGADGITVYGGASIWVPENYVQADPLTHNGIIITSDYMGAMIGGVFTAKILKTGSFFFGNTAGKQISFNVSTGDFIIDANVEVKNSAGDLFTAGDLFGRVSSTIGSSGDITISPAKKLKITNTVDGVGCISFEEGSGANSVWTTIEAIQGLTLIKTPQANTDFQIGGTSSDQFRSVIVKSLLVVDNVKDADGTSRSAGAVFKGGYRASLKLTSAGTLNLDDIVNGTTYKLVTATNLTNFETAYTRVSNVINSSYSLWLASTKNINFASLSAISATTGSGTFWAGTTTELLSIGTEALPFSSIEYYATTGHNFYIGNNMPLYLSSTGASITGKTEISNTVAGYYEGLKVANASTATNAYCQFGMYSGLASLYIGVVDAAYSNWTGGSYIWSVHENGRLSLGAANAEKMAIMPDGKVRIGMSTAPDALLDVANRASGAIATYTVRTRHIDGKAVSDYSMGHLYLQYNAAGYGVVIGDSGTDHPLTVYGTVTVNTLAGSGTRSVYSTSTGALTNTSSDRALKVNDQAITYGLDAVMKLRPISFNWIRQEVMGSQKELGFIAQEVEAIIPELVGINYDGMRSLDYAKMTAVLCKAIQELNEKLERLNTK